MSAEDAADAVNAGGAADTDEPQPPPEEPGPVTRTPANRTARVGALLCLGAAVLTMIGTFQNLLISEQGSSAGEQRFVITAWQMFLDSGQDDVSTPENAPLNGVPLLCAVAVLIAAAAFGMRAAVRPGLRPSRMPALLAVVGAAFLAAVVATIGAQELWWLEVLQPPPPDAVEGGPDGNDVTVGPAYWMLVAGTGTAIAAAVLTWRQHRPEPERVEPDTPRLGVPVVHRLPDETPDAPPDAPRAEE